MHDTAIEAGSYFLSNYWRQHFSKILDVGSLNVNGSLRDYAPGESTFVGLDIEAGDGVDVVLDKPQAPFPFEDKSFDVIVSTSCFEHDQMFWKTFLEMVRTVKSDGYIYINAPSNGVYHGYPYDNWRFYPDSARALCEWAKTSGYADFILVESMILQQAADIWNDCVMVFAGPDAELPEPGALLADKFPSAYNVRRFDRENFENFNVLTEDLVKLGEKDAEIKAEFAKYKHLEGEHQSLVKSHAELLDLYNEAVQKCAAANEELRVLECTMFGKIARFFNPRKTDNASA